MMHMPRTAAAALRQYMYMCDTAAFADSKSKETEYLSTTAAVATLTEYSAGQGFDLSRTSQKFLESRSVQSIVYIYPFNIYAYATASATAVHSREILISYSVTQ